MSYDVKIRKVLSLIEKVKFWVFASLIALALTVAMFTWLLINLASYVVDSCMKLVTTCSTCAAEATSLVLYHLTTLARSSLTSISGGVKLLAFLTGWVLARITLYFAWIKLSVSGLNN